MASLGNILYMRECVWGRLLESVDTNLKGSYMYKGTFEGKKYIPKDGVYILATKDAHYDFVKIEKGEVVNEYFTRIPRSTWSKTSFALGIGVLLDEKSPEEPKRKIEKVEIEFKDKVIDVEFEEIEEEEIKEEKEPATLADYLILKGILKVEVRI